MACGWLSGRRRPAAAAVLVARLELVELFHRVDHVRDVEEPVAFEADVDERRLHAGQDFVDPALVDVTDDPALVFPFDENLGHQVVFENGHDGLVDIRGDDHLLGHARNS